jgi:tRNA nucleotidyltransferase/poly(A) polymerase
MDFAQDPAPGLTTIHPLHVLLCADPLRVMRAVRFATRFGFALDAAILDAASSEEVGAQHGISDDVTLT